MFLSLLFGSLAFMAFKPDNGAGDAGNATPAPAGGQAGDPPAAQVTPAQADPAPSTEDDPGEETIPAAKLKDRLDRARREAVDKLLKDLGIDKPETLKELVSTEQKRREGEMTDLQKLQRDYKALEGERDALKAKYDTLVGEVQQDRINNALTGAARHAKHPEDVITWARSHAAAELDAILGENGKADEAKAKAIVAKCQKARPEWFNADTPGVPSNSGATTPGSAQDIKKVGEVAAKQARSFL